MSIKDKLSRSISDDQELEFDICMKCGRRMPDRKYGTLRRHQNEFHPKNNKDKAFMFFNKHPMFSILSIMVIAITVLLVMPSDMFSTFIINILNPIILGLKPDTIILSESSYKTCSEEVTNLDKSIYKNNGLTISDIGQVNHLIKDCNLFLENSQYGPPITSSKIYSTP